MLRFFGSSPQGERDQLCVRQRNDLILYEADAVDKSYLSRPVGITERNTGTVLSAAVYKVKSEEIKILIMQKLD